LKTTKIGFYYALHLYFYLPDAFINYYVGYNQIQPDIGEIYRFYDGGVTGNIVINKIVKKQLATPKFKCKPDSIEQNYRQIECNTQCFQEIASKKCNCSFKSDAISIK